MKIDLRKFYRQIYYDPGSVHLVGFHLNDKSKLYWDIVLSMGLRIACYIAQTISSAILHIYRSAGNSGVNYIDDLAAVALWSRATAAFNSLIDILNQIRVEESIHKRCSPDVVMAFLGVRIDSLRLLLSLTPERVIDIRNECTKWQGKRCASRRDVQQLVGKLSFAATTVRSGRLFFSRILNFLRGLPKHGIRPIPWEVRKDVDWWSKFMIE